MNLKSALRFRKGTQVGVFGGFYARKDSEPGGYVAVRSLLSFSFWWAYLFLGVNLFAFLTFRCERIVKPRKFKEFFNKIVPTYHRLAITTLALSSSAYWTLPRESSLDEVFVGTNQIECLYDSELQIHNDKTARFFESMKHECVELPSLLAIEQNVTECPEFQKFNAQKGRCEGETVLEFTLG